jgi:phage terminase large subunit-like protein
MDSHPSWIFDGSPIEDPFGYGERAVGFLKALRHPKSTLPGFKFYLPEWQERIVRAIYGPRHEDGRRKIRTVVILIPRGNRKTSLGAALGLLHTIGPENVQGGECLFAASDKKQARIAFEEAMGIINMFPEDQLKRLRRTDSINRITNPKKGAFLEAISSEAGAHHGRTPVFALIDELHVWKRRVLWDVIISGMRKVSGTLRVIITTAGRGQDNIAFETIERARKIARGDIDDPTWLPVLFETPADADWRDEAVWHRVNPGLKDGFPDLEAFRADVKAAADSVGAREEFRQLALNVWLDSSTDPFVEMSIYDEGVGDIDDVDLEGEPCWIAVDMAEVHDLAAVVACFRDGEDGFLVKPWFFCPADNLRRRADKDGVPYPAWAEEGYITPTPGSTIDEQAIEDWVRELCARYDVREIACDPHMTRRMMSRLVEDGLPAVEMRQGWVTMAPAVRELERAIVGRRFRHGGHPVLRWNFSNIAVETDKAGNKTFHKGKSTDRIDGAVASAMAVARCAAGNAPTIYASEQWSEDMAYF